MRIALALLLVLHGLVHLLGFVKAFDLAPVQGLQAPIAPATGVGWLVATVLLCTAGGMLLVGYRYWWLPALGGVVLSQLLVIGAWNDARFGTVANLLILIPAALAGAELRPSSIPQRYRRAAVEERAAREAPGSASVVADATVEEADLAALPGAVGRWLRRVGVVGRSRPRGVHLTFQAGIRDGAQDPWMEGTAEQYSFLEPPLRLFRMKVTRAGIPVDVYHRYGPGEVTMEARLAGVLPVVDESGEALARAETVTFLNDVFLFLPAAVPYLGIQWDTAADGEVRAIWENRGHRVTAELRFSPEGDLVEFRSRDRRRSGGAEGEPILWTTPVLTWQKVDGLKLPRQAEAVWGEGEDAWVYARLELTGARFLGPR